MIQHPWFNYSYHFCVLEKVAQIFFAYLPLLVGVEIGNILGIIGINIFSLLYNYTFY